MPDSTGREKAGDKGAGFILSSDTCLSPAAGGSVAASSRPPIVSTRRQPRCPCTKPFALLGLGGAALAAGAINAVAGGGSLISFPALVAFG